MGSTFGGLNISLTALYASQRGMDVTGQNIANVNTDGYSRQRVALQAIAVPPVASLYSTDDGTGGGVTVSGVARLQDSLLVNRARTEHAQDSYLKGVSDGYSQVEQVFQEPSDTGLQAQFGTLWANFHDVANNPGDLPTRSALLQQAGTVASDLNDAHNALAKTWSLSQQALGTRMIQINTAADNVAQLNQTIRSAQNSGVPDNALVDQRDQAVMQLSELTGASAIDRKDGTVDLYLSGSILVSGDAARHLQVAGATRLEDQGTSPVTLQWTDTHATAAVTSGQVAADMQTLGQILPGQSAAIDQVASALITSVNTQQAAGYDLSGQQGGPLFSGTGAADIAVAITDPKLVAASGTPGGNLDGSNATALANLATSASGPNVIYGQMIANLGVNAQAAKNRATSQDGVKQQVDNAAAGQSGVNLDEEMTNLLTFQRAYEAAARVMSSMDGVLDTLINHTGR